MCCVSGRTQRPGNMDGERMNELDNHTLDVLVRGAAPIPGIAEDDERVFTETWSRVQASIHDDAVTAGSAEPQRRGDLIGGRVAAMRPRRRGVKLAAVAIAAAVLGGGTAAAATGFFSTRTGRHNSGWQVTAAGSGELLNTGGTDRARVFDEITADIPFAPGYERQRAWALDFFPSETDSVLSEGALRSWMAGNAVCTWADAWVAADTAGDVTARAAATTVLTEAVTWKDIVESDQRDAIILDSGEHLSYRWWIRPLADAARAGDRAALLATVAQSIACPDQVLPAIDAAPDHVVAGVR